MSILCFPHTRWKAKLSNRRNEIVSKVKEPIEQEVEEASLITFVFTTYLTHLLIPFKYLTLSSHGADQGGHHPVFDIAVIVMNFIGSIGGIHGLNHT